MRLRCTYDDGVYDALWWLEGVKEDDEIDSFDPVPVHVTQGETTTDRLSLRSILVHLSPCMLNIWRHTDSYYYTG